HLDKYARGFEHLIDVWGVDHIGDVARLRGGLQALGKDPATLEFLIHQHVRLRNEGEAVRMSKRTGEFVTLRDLLGAVGRDAARARPEPQRLCAYARELAEAFHVFYTQCRVLTDDATLTAARLMLVDAARRGLRNTLDLVGVAAAERM